MRGLSNGPGLPTVAASLCRFFKLRSQNRKTVEMETKNHPSESKLEQFPVQFAVGFPVMMKVSHLNILMHLIFCSNEKSEIKCLLFKGVFRFSLKKSNKRQKVFSFLL